MSSLEDDTVDSEAEELLSTMMTLLTMNTLLIKVTSGKVVRENGSS